MTHSLKEHLKFLKLPMNLKLNLKSKRLQKKEQTLKQVHKYKTIGLSPVVLYK